LKSVEAEIVIKALAKIGFQPVRQRGSHLIMKHPDGRSTVIPVHPGEELGRGVPSSRSALNLHALNLIGLRRDTIERILLGSK